LSQPPTPSKSPVRSAIVTGASSGIGAATAEAFGALGWRVSLGARRLDRLEEVAKRVESAGGEPFFHSLDVSDPGSIDVFYQASCDALGPVEVLVNNAGMNMLNHLVDARPADLQYEIAVNLTGAILMARRVVPAMLERREGDVVWVSSENAVRPRPFQIGYTAAKAGLEGAARVLGMETEGTGVRSMIVRVGPTGTEFGNALDEGKLHEALESWRYWGVQRHLRWMPASSVANVIAKLVTTPVEESYPTVIEVMPGGHSKEHR